MDMVSYVGNIGIALMGTFLLEAPVVGYGLVRNVSDKRKLWMNFAIINAITNITINTFVMLGNWAGIWLAPGIIIAELVIPLVEAKMYQYTTDELSWKRLVVTCYIANAISFLLGSFMVSFVRG